ncbi:MAG: hypothetical protein KME26_02965 [Oscillatoria princeps RMCB-10]|nr:hypothetical protein [Oscillatoria princeps RMCB-10]
MTVNEVGDCQRVAVAKAPGQSRDKGMWRLYSVPAAGDGYSTAPPALKDALQSFRSKILN